MDSYLDFLTDDIKNGLLKNKCVGIIRRTMKITTNKQKEFKVFYNRSFLLECDPFVVLNVKWWVE